MLDAFEFNLELRSLTHPRDCAELFLRAIAPFAFDTFLCGEMDLIHRERTAFYIVHWPDAWREFYQASGFIEHDPVVEALMVRTEPFTWSELRAEGLMRLKGDARDLVSRFGWVEGLAIPLSRGKGKIGGVTLAGRREGVDAAARAYLTLIATCLHSHVRTLVGEHGFSLPPGGLTQREMDCLKLVAQGKTDRQIAAALSIAVSTAHEYVENAKRKLVAASRPELAAVAASLGIVDL